MQRGTFFFVLFLLNDLFCFQILQVGWLEKINTRAPCVWSFCFLICMCSLSSHRFPAAPTPTPSFRFFSWLVVECLFVLSVLSSATQVTCGPWGREWPCTTRSRSCPRCRSARTPCTWSVHGTTRTHTHTYRDTWTHWVRLQNCTRPDYFLIKWWWKRLDSFAKRFYCFKVLTLLRWFFKCIHIEVCCKGVMETLFAY